MKLKPNKLRVLRSLVIKPCVLRANALLPTMLPLNMAVLTLRLCLGLRTSALR